MKAKDKIKYFFRRNGISLKLGEDARPVDLTRIQNISPLQLGYMAEGRSFFASIPIEKIIHLEHMAFGLNKEDSSPFVRVLLDYQKNQTEYKNSVLEKYYELCQPDSVSRFMGVENPKNQELERLSVPYSPRIFSNDSLKKTYEYCVDRTLMENRRETGKKITLERGRSLYGPTSWEKGEIEFLRLVKTMESIKSKGYKFDKTGVDAISGVFLTDDDTGEWVFSVNSGQHRVACLSVLGYSHVIVHVMPKGRAGTLESKASKYFPIVKNGILSTEEAEKLLKRKVKKEQPACASSWLEFVSGQKN